MVEAIAARACLSTGTGTGVLSPGTITVPWSVPKAMVVTGTPSLAASAAALALLRPSVVAPSDISTIAAGTGEPSGAGGTDCRAPRLV